MMGGEKTQASAGVTGPAGQAPAAALLAGPPKVVNVGLDRFREDLEQAGAAVIQVEWSPPAGGDVALGRLLARLGS